MVDSNALDGITPQTKGAEHHGSREKGPRKADTRWTRAVVTRREVDAEVGRVSGGEMQLRYQTIREFQAASWGWECHSLVTRPL